jgi:hypothetical protein
MFVVASLDSPTVETPAAVLASTGGLQQSELGTLSLHAIGPSSAARIRVSLTTDNSTLSGEDLVMPELIWTPIIGRCSPQQFDHSPSCLDGNGRCRRPATSPAAPVRL